MSFARTHTPRWFADRCLPCGACTRRCPVTVFPEQQDEPDSLRARVFLHASVPTGMGLDGRIVRPNVPPCVASCPLGQDVPGYVGALARGQTAEAARIIRETNPMPSVCGHVCPASCMRACVRSSLDSSVAIRALKRYALLAAPGAPAAPGRRAGRSAVAVVGGGPAGLSAAWFLARNGVSVTVFEAADRPGGLLRRAVGRFDLPEELLDSDIRAILSAGVEMRTGERIAGARPLSRLKGQGYAAVLVATGAGRGAGLDLDGFDRLEGTWDALSFAGSVNGGDLGSLAGPVVVVGGGAAAVTVARMAVRLGAGPVHLAMPRDATHSPSPRTLRLAEQEGIRLWPETSVVELKGNGRVAAAVLAPLRMRAADAGRRFAVGADHGGRRVVPARTVVAASLRFGDPAWFNGDPVGVGPLGNLLSAPDTFNLGPEWLFGAGEAVTGPKTVVEALATGVAAARSVLDWIDRGGSAAPDVGTRRPSGDQSSGQGA